MDTKVPEDKGAGVGQSGVETPYETGNLGNTSDWAARPRKNSGSDAMNHNRKNAAGSGRAWDHPWEHPSSPLGTLGPMDKNDSGKA